MSKQGADELLRGQLAKVRAVFYAQRKESEWWQDQGMLKQAVTELSRYLHERGTGLSGERQAAILTAVWRTIATNGDLGQVRRMAPYLLHSVQEHLRHHGEEYYGEAKRARTAGEVAGEVLQGLRRAQDTAGVTAALAQLRPLLTSRAGRKRGGRKGGADAVQGELL